MKPQMRWAIVFVAGLLLLVLPSALRLMQPRTGPASTYAPPTVLTTPNAATPIPTRTPVALPLPAPVGLEETGGQVTRGAVVVDLAHYSLIDRDRFQPLAAALAQRGLDLRFWLPPADTANIKDVTKFPDLSTELAKQLSGADALIVISPYFLYTPNEIAAVRKFIHDGDRLLVISDPDIESDAARDTNVLASEFNIVFNEDYLYDTVANDENYTYFFEGDYYDQAAALAGSKIALYGARSISGDIVPQVRSSPTTLSSRRIGLTNFDTVVVGGLRGDTSLGHVLGMGDFDVLTTPFVTRHDNRKLLGFVADFLGGAERSNTIVDFPNFLGKQVALAIDNTTPVGASALGQAATLQQMLQDSGRTLDLASGATWLELQQPADRDLIYVAGYRTAADQTPLLADLGITLTEEIITPTVVAAPTVPPVTAMPAPVTATIAPAPAEAPGIAPAVPVTPTLPPPDLPTKPALPIPAPVLPTPAPEATATATPPGPAPITTTTGLTLPLLQGEVVTPTVAPTAIATDTSPAGLGATPGQAMEPITATSAVTSATAALTATGDASAPTPTATPLPTPQITLYLERSDGMRLIAAETQLFVRQTDANGRNVLAVLGADGQSINAAVTRLLNRDFAGCLVQGETLICPYAPGGTGASTSSGSAAGGYTAAARPTPTGAAVPAPGETPMPKPTAPQAPPGTAGEILIVDDNAQADSGEDSEAAIYLTVLTSAGYKVNLWVTGEQGFPDIKDLDPYRWVVWSDASYATSGVTGDALRVISGYINEGGRLTISSRMPFFGVGSGTPSPIKDIVVTDELPALVEGLPKTPITLAAETPPLNPLQANPDPEASAQAALARGPASGSAGAPVLMLLSDQNMEQPKGAFLMLFAMSMGWLPNAVSDQLIQNMAQVMLAE